MNEDILLENFQIYSRLSSEKGSNGMTRFFCRKCGYISSIDKHFWKCPKCGHPLDLVYDIEWSPKGRGIARYTSLLPIKPLKTLGEGSTPIVKEEFNGIRIYFKLEYLNPSGSFKDRGTVIALSYARQLGYSRVLEDTSGNTGVSIALYATAYGLKATIVMPSYAPEGKKKLIKLFNGEIVETPTRSDAAKKVIEILEEKPNYFYVAHTWSPFYIEGYKTIVYELYEDSIHVDSVIAPIGSGGLFIGLYRGFKDLVELGLIRDIPLMVGVQGVSVAPVYTSVTGKSISGDSSLADGVMVANPPRLKEIVSIIRENGCITVVDNRDIVEALKWLLSKGYIVEPTSAAALAGLWKLLNSKECSIGKKVLIPLTGSGLKMFNEIYNAILIRS